MNKWNHVSKSLPDVGQDCIGFLNFGEKYDNFCDFAFVRHVGHGFFERYFGGRLVELAEGQFVDYWMELPERPND